MNTFAFFFPSFALFSGLVNNRLLKHVAISGPIVKFVLLILLAFSVISWAIILLKYRSFKGIEKEQENFLNMFYEGKTMNQLLEYAEKRDKRIPMIQLFKAGYTELVRFKRTARQDLEGTNSNEEGGDLRMSASIDPVDGIERAMRKTINEQQSDLESYLPFLATCGSTTPFIGLFGTVWGIMNAFAGIGATGSASLATVAPGIAEALIATAAGLAAAIPAVIFYNLFLNRVRRNVTSFESFTTDFINFIERNIERLT